MNSSILFIVLYLITSAILSVSGDKHEKTIIKSGQDFVKKDIQEFIKTAREDQSLSEFYKDLFVYVADIQRSMNKMTEKIANLMIMDVLVTDVIGNNNRLVVNSISVPALGVQSLASDSSIKLEFARKWIGKRIFHVKDRNSRRKLARIQTKFIEAKNQLEQMAKNIIVHNELGNKLSLSINYRDYNEIELMIDELIELEDFLTRDNHLNTVFEAVLLLDTLINPNNNVY